MTRVVRLPDDVLERWRLVDEIAEALKASDVDYIQDPATGRFEGSHPHGGGGGGAEYGGSLSTHGKVTPYFKGLASRAIGAAPSGLVKQIGPVPVHVFDSVATLKSQGGRILGAPRNILDALSKDTSGLSHRRLPGEPKGSAASSISLIEGNIRNGYPEVRYVLHHEMMHQLNYKYGISDGKPMQDAFRKDMDRLVAYLDSLKPQDQEAAANEILGLYGHYLSSPAEAFAAAGAQILGPSPPDEGLFYGERFEDVFQNTSDYVRGVLSEKGIIAPAGGGAGPAAGP